MATEKAYRLAYKNLYYFDLFDDHTIWHPATAYFGATKVLTVRYHQPARATCIAYVRSVGRESPWAWGGERGERNKRRSVDASTRVCEIPGRSTRLFVLR